MSRRKTSDLNFSFQDLKRIPLMEKCRDGLKETAVFYQEIKALREDSRIHETVGTRNLKKIVRELQQKTVAYAPSSTRTTFKNAASAYADSLVSTAPDHPVSALANAEIRIRKLELLCVGANLKYGGPWEIVYQQGEAELARVIESWQQCLPEVVCV